MRPLIKIRLDLDDIGDVAGGVAVLILIFLLLFLGAFWYFLLGAIASFILYAILHIKVLLTLTYILIGLDALASGLTTLLIILGVISR